jgi:hypothetical protein
MRAMVRDAGRRAFVDRFLVPRGWAEGPYAIDVFKHYERGPVRRTRVWYQLDERGPEAVLRYDAGARLLRIDTGRETAHVSTVEVHLAPGRVLTLTPVGGTWVVPAHDLTTFLRGAPRSRREPNGHRVPREGDEPTLPRRRDSPPPRRSQSVTPVPIVSASGPLSLEETWSCPHEGRTLRVAAADVRLRPDPRAVARLGNEVVRDVRRDLVALRCRGPTGAAGGGDRGPRELSCRGARSRGQRDWWRVLGRGLTICGRVA